MNTVPSDLFASSSVYLPQWLERETLYSWLSRYHRLSGNISARYTSMQLFGHPTAGLRHDFPTHLDQLIVNANGILGSQLALINERTLYAFHAPFLDETTSADVLLAMRAGSVASIRDSLGFAASRLGVPAPLKACQACIREDISTHQTSWWRTEQQWPTVRICMRHQEPLLVAKDDIHNRTQRDLILPTDLDNHNTHPEPDLDANQFKRLKLVAEWTVALIGQHKFGFNRTLLRHVYLLQAKKLGLVAMDGSLRFQSLRDSFTKTHLDLGSLPGLSFLESVSSVNGGFIGLLLRQYNGSRHPMKHIYLMAFLFSNSEEFFELYRSVAATAANEGTRQLHAQLTDIHSSLRDLVVNQGKSVNSAASALDITTAQAVRYLKKENVPYSKRPRVLNPTLEAKLKKMLQAGDEREEIATKLGIRKSFIKDYLFGNSSLRSAWEQAHSERKLEAYRNHFLQLLKKNPCVSMKRIRQTPGSGYQWLYRNDLCSGQVFSDTPIGFFAVISFS